MIRRIQSVFLLLAAASAFGLFALPFATTPRRIPESALFIDGQYDVNDNTTVLIIFGLTGVLALISIFLFKNRKGQMRMVRMAVVGDIIGLVLAIIVYMQGVGDLDKSISPDDGLGLYLPLLFLIFSFLALRFIKKDEKLVRSSERLR